MSPYFHCSCSTSNVNVGSESKAQTSDNNIGGTQSDYTNQAATTVSGALAATSQVGGGLSAGASASGMGGEVSQENGAAAGENDVQDSTQILRERETERIMASDALQSRILMLERAVQQNVYHRQHLDCRDLPDIEPLILLSG